jgi:hypothetical protein
MMSSSMSIESAARNRRKNSEHFQKLCQLSLAHEWQKCLRAGDVDKARNIIVRKDKCEANMAEIARRRHEDAMKRQALKGLANVLADILNASDDESATVDGTHGKAAGTFSN